MLGLGRTDDALEVLSESLALIREHNLLNEYLVSNHIAFAEALLRDVDKILVMGNSERRRYLRRARRYVNKGLRLAQKFRNHLGYALRVRASYHRLCGQPSRAERDFARSEEVLRDGGRVYELGLTLFEKARWRSREGDFTDFEELERAIEYFRKVGARRDLEEAWGILGLKNTGDDREQRLRSEHHQLSSLFKMSRTISSILDLNRLVSQITDLAVEVTGGERGYLFLSSSSHGGLPEVRCARDMDRQDIEHDLAPAIEELVKKTWQSGVPQFASFLTPGYTRECSMIAVPLRAGEETFGLIYVENNLTRNLYSQEDVEFLTAFASQAAISLQNASLYQKAEELNLSLENKVQERTRELLESKQQLEYANRLKSEFLANMSHELRTPLNAVIAMSEILIERTFGDLTEKQEIYATQILDAGVHLLSLINDVLDLSKVEAGQLELDVAAFSLEDVLKRSLLVIKERAAKHRVALELRQNSSVDLLYGDARRIKQTVLNLLTNAVKFTPEGGRVWIEARDEDDEVIVCISDTGIGISEDDLESHSSQFASTLLLNI